MARPSPPTKTSKPHRMTYRIGRGEQGVLTFEPYKSAILPLWRFKTATLAQRSASQIYDKFLDYDARDDFVGMDMCRKFLQMGMTRAKRYANHAGGRKYDRATGEQLPQSSSHAGAAEKLEASRIFREVWEKAKAYEGYVEKKGRFLAEQRVWDREVKRKKEEEGGG